MLTHEQAAQLLTISLAETPLHVRCAHGYNEHVFLWAYKLGLIVGSRSSQDIAIWKLTDAGREALDKYDAEWVTVRREHLEELRDTAKIFVGERMRIFDGYPHKMSIVEPTEQAIAHANEVLEGK